MQIKRRFWKSQNLYFSEQVSFTYMGALFWTEIGTCLSKGTGSAFKDGGLQGDGLKAVLATAVVFGRACGAASTTQANEKRLEKPGTSIANGSEKAVRGENPNGTPPQTTTRKL